MVLPSEEVLELHKVLDTGTEEEKKEARKELREILKREAEEEKKNPPPWGKLML